MSFTEDLKICRVCLRKTATVSIFDKQENMIISTKIMRCVNINIMATDGLPSHICASCESELAICYNFIARCEASDQCLRDNYLDAFLEHLEPKDEPEVEDEIHHLDDTDFLIDQGEIKEEDMIIEEEKQELPIKKNTRQVHKKQLNNKNIGPSQCTVCGLVVNCPSAMTIHSRKHSGERPFACTKCDRKFATKGTLKRHFDTHCLIKTRRVSVKSNISKKKNVQREKSNPIQCVVCGLMVKSPSAMEIHSRTHTGEKPFACETCDKKFTTKGTLNRHFETRHSKKRERKFTCETCGSSFYRKNEIIVHIRTHTGEKPYVCPFCSRRFLQISSLIRHKRTHTGDKPYPCPICNKHFADRSLIAKHMSVHSNERNFTCHLCNKSLKSKNSLKTHLILHTNEKLNVCNFCGMSFSFKGNLKIHIRRVHSEKSGQCNICMKPFSNLEAHMWKHTGEKPFSCSYCDRSFSTKVSLTTHTLFRHKNIEKYKCTLCTKTFPIPSMLEFHLLKQHTNHTPFVCQHCSRGFFRASDLSRHLRVSHMDIPVKIKTPNSENTV